MSEEFQDLYPFLGSEPTDAEPVLADVRQSTLQKDRDVRELRSALWEEHAADLVRAVRILAEAFRNGGKVLAFGNGGSSTDAADFVSDLLAPPRPDWRPLPALDLTRDTGVLTAVANDVNVASIFVRQVIAHGREGDVAVGFSTSGESQNVLDAFERARSMGLHTVGFAGQKGGSMAREGFLDAVVVAPSDYIPRIQEAHATAYHALLAMLHRTLGSAAEPDIIEERP